MKQPNTFTIYNASAGSGKTFTLVKEYLALLLTSNRPDSYRNILAITFTNKAVAEMKSRIIEGLHTLTNEEGQTSLLTLLAEDTGLTSEEIRTRSRRILKSIINNYASFEVSTIDGFTHRVLRTFAKDLELPLNFEVELNTQEVLNEAVDRVINLAGQDAALTKVLVNFVLSKTDDDKSWDISRDLLSIANLLTQETSRPYLELLSGKNLDAFKALGEELKKHLKEEEGAAVKIAADFFELIRSRGIESTDFTRGSCPKFFEKIAKKNFKIDLHLQWQENIASQNLYSKSLASGKKDVLDELQPQIADMFGEVKNHILRIQFLKAVEKNLVPLSLLSAIQNQIEEIKKENSIVLISDFNATIGKAVKNQPAPFIYERLGERYRHYFIDEFQDTSQLQWENLIPLVDHTLSVEHIQEEHGSLTLVGDAKQSIYRWRGGKAEQFMELCGEKNPFNIEEKRLVMLPNNYRSAKNIVDFNNDFFRFSSSCFDHEAHQTLFENSGQQSISEKEGYVNLSFIEAENAEEEMEIYPQRVLEIIRNLEAEGVSKSSVCILTRRKKEGIAIANYLGENDIAVISSESLLLSRSPEVNFINSILKYSLDIADKELRFEILDFLLKGKISTENDFKFLTKTLELEGQAFFDALKEQNIHFDLEVLTSLSVYEGVEYIIRSFGLVKSSNAYLQFYLDFVFEASNSTASGIFEFLELWDRKKDDLSIVVPEGEDAVQIMTIHRAKGLEFPVVIYPFANSTIQDTARESIWMNLPEGLSSNIGVAYLKASEKMKFWGGEAPRLYEELCFNSQLDALNVLYVALTRPVDRLYVISKMELDKKGQENLKKFSGLFISYLKQIGKWTGETEYEFGQTLALPEVEPLTRSSVPQEVFYSSPTESNGISIITRSGMLWNSKQKSAIEKGNLVHELFARINSKKDIEQVLFTAREEGMFKDQDEVEIEELIREVIQHPELEAYYSEDAVNYNEKDVFSGTGEILRPDRLNFCGNKVSLIDYKTGAEDVKHGEQINSYAAVLEKMGYEIDRKLLVYLNNDAEVRIV
ncbi:ATP-dependent exoDNAse (exonuclease V) beta subunit (contains helicase and exonuclease domains) [Salinimicrobium catena]|uniref:DNA 3'-5' helicase n=1 Tax=Salinimicrobium catena TaxID=390640 RepID=A0A1H5IVN9_9FLAO|nr:UvrD-helicase domain-containing protein [Salinimicrobium catena]SDK81310.1 ATP-dependent exoDNAse (exonuclease V) beta subunit (contains helicase and exonuclease domains) [Salinimicrobium catena]SEE44315.1 ATP-dependent exoDNAse (exonuclease V) beta subunit (contains helicase and exonuclease domains) [Salinimicrobium catena]